MYWTSSPTCHSVCNGHYSSNGWLPSNGSGIPIVPPHIPGLWAWPYNVPTEYLPTQWKHPYIHCTWSTGLVHVWPLHTQTCSITLHTWPYTHKYSMTPTHKHVGWPYTHMYIHVHVVWPYSACRHVYTMQLHLSPLQWGTIRVMPISIVTSAC